MLKISLTLLAILTLSSCANMTRLVDDEGNVGISYYADKTINSLEVPPDLTQPKTNNAFKLEGLTTAEKIDFDNTNIGPLKKIVSDNISIEVKKNNYQSYLVIGKNSGYVFNIAKNFFRDNGFVIEQEDKLTGLFKTNYLEQRTAIPDKNLNIIRSMIQNRFGARYSLPALDSYRVRVEATDDNQSELYLSLHSMQEVVTNENQRDENTIWQEKPRDEFIETEMLYRLMLYLGNDELVAKNKIERAIGSQSSKVELRRDINNFAKLIFNDNKEEVWSAIAFAIDKLDIKITDRDKKDGSFYIAVVGGEDENNALTNFVEGRHNFIIKIREMAENFSEVSLIDLKNENTENTKEFGYVLFNKIAEIL